MRILFLTSRLPFPPIGGDKIRTYNFIRHLNEKYDLTIVSFVERSDDLEAAHEYQADFNKLLTVKLPKFRSYLNCVKGLLSRAPLQTHYYQSKAMRRAVENELKEGYDIVFCHLIRMAQYLPEGFAVKRVVDFTDAISLNYSRSKGHRKGPFSIIDAIEEKRVFEYEHATIKNSDLSIFISDVDASYLWRSLTRKKIKVITNGVDFDTFQFNRADAVSNRFVFLGNMRTFPNADAALFFAGEILPLIQQVHPDVSFHIVGSEPTQEVRQLHDGKNIVVTGMVDSVLPHLNQGSIFVAPMRAGAGMQNKILEAMAVGLPVITTDIGAEGLDRTKLLIGNSADDFCIKALNLLEDEELQHKQSLLGRQYIEDNFTWSRKFKELDVCLKGLLLTEAGNIQTGVRTHDAPVNDRQLAYPV